MSKVYQTSCTYTTVGGKTVWEALRKMADYLEITENCLDGIEPCSIEVQYHESDGDWTVSVLTDYVQTI